MRKKVILSLLLTLSVFVFVGCGKTTKTETQLPTTIDQGSKVIDVIKLSNDSDTTFSGVVFGIVKDGFYVSDGTAGVYVKLSSSNLSSLDALKVGDLVEVKGKFVKSNNAPFVKNAAITVNGTGKDPLVAVSKTISQINELDLNDPQNYGILFHIECSVSLDAANRVIFKDETGSVIIDDATAQDYKKFIGKKIKTDIVLSSRDSSSVSWNAQAFINSAKEYLADLDEVKDAIFNTISLPEEVYGSLELKKEYLSEPSIAFSWSVESGEGLTIKDNIASVDLSIKSDSLVTLKLTLISGEKSASKTFTTTIKAIENVSISDGKLSGGKYVIISGLVVSRGIADETASHHYIIIMDEATKELATIDTTSEIRKSVNVGDRIQVVASYRSTELPSFTDVLNLKVEESGVKIDYASLNPVVLETSEDYQKAIDDNHDSIVLYKVVNPFMVSSGNTTFSWYQFGPTQDAAKNGLISSRQCCFLIRNFSENGLKDFESTYNVPLKDAGASQYFGTTIYAYSVYQTGATKWSFIIPDTNALVYNEVDDINGQLDILIPEEVKAQEAGALTLPTSIKTIKGNYNLTWLSSNPEILANDGSYQAVSEKSDVTFEASYTIETETKKFSKTISFIPKEIVVLSVSEVKDLSDNSIVEAFTGIIVGFGAGSSGSGSTSAIYITDGITLMAITSFSGVLSNPDKSYDIFLNGADVALKVNDIITLYNVTKNNDAILTDVSTTGTLNGEKTGNDWFKLSVDSNHTIDSNEKIATYLSSFDTASSKAKDSFAVYKIVGTVDNPLYFAATNDYFISLFYKTDSNKDAVDMNGASFPIGYTTEKNGYFGVNTRSLLKAVRDNDWLVKYTPITDFEDTAYITNCTKASTNEILFQYGFTGEMYVIFSYSGSVKYPYCSHGVLGAGFNLTSSTVSE